VRAAVPDAASLDGFRAITAASPLPVVADIHFDANLALRAVECGAAGLRINPGNIGGRQRVREILRVCDERAVPIRIGVNAGSLEKSRRRGDLPLHEAMVESVLDWVRFFEDCGFFRIKLSLKASDVRCTVAAYRLLHQRCDYPLHIGVTEAGTLFSGTVKSAVGLGALLLDGIGDTLRVSLTADPCEEVRVAREILSALGLLPGGIELISCPTCARTSTDLIAQAQELERRLAGLHAPRRLKVALMGCEVNGPGEAAEADIGLAFSHRNGFLFRRGVMIARVPLAEAVDRLVQEVEREIRSMTDDDPASS